MNSVAYARLRMWSGYYFKQSTYLSFGLYFDNNSSATSATLYGFSFDGTNGTDVALTTISEGEAYLITVELIPGSGIKFYVNGSLVGTVTSNLPSGTTGAEDVFSIEIYNYEATDKIAQIDQIIAYQEV
jgi:hypothetical protein